MYFDTALAGYRRALAAPYEQTLSSLSGDLFVRKATLDYLGSARYDDVLEIGMRCARIGSSSIRFDGAAFLQERLLVSCELVYVFAEPTTQTAMPVPQKLRDVLQAFEDGEAMVDVRLGAWDALGRDAGAIRTEVFIDEQRIPAEMEWDAADAGCVHAVAFNRFGLALATGRLLRAGPGVARVGRLAVRQGMRGSRLGGAVLDALMAAARDRGDHEVVLSAQIRAQAFYIRAGFAPRGAVFEEAGIAHQEMARAL